MFLKSLFTSKKFVASLAGVLVACIATMGINLPTDALAAVISPIIAYVVGQGVADHGKERAKIEANS